MQRNWSRIFVLAMGIPLLLAILAACGGTGTGGNPSSSTTGVIKVATELPVTGGDASSGKPAENGAHMAVDEAANAISNYKLQFVAKDDVGASGTHDPTV